MTCEITAGRKLTSFINNNATNLFIRGGKKGKTRKALEERNEKRNICDGNVVL